MLIPIWWVLYAYPQRDIFVPLNPLAYITIALIVARADLSEADMAGGMCYFNIGVKWQ